MGGGVVEAESKTGGAASFHCQLSLMKERRRKKKKKKKKKKEEEKVWPLMKTEIYASLSLVREVEDS